MIEAHQKTRTSLIRAPHLKRYRKIVSVFARHGFGSFLTNLQLERRISLPPRLPKPDTPSQRTAAEHLCLALEELGPTYNYFNLMNQVQVGIVGGMADIFEAQRHASKVISL